MRYLSSCIRSVRSRDERASRGVSGFTAIMVVPRGWMETVTDGPKPSRFPTYRGWWAAQWVARKAADMGRLYERCPGGARAKSARHPASKDAWDARPGWGREMRPVRKAADMGGLYEHFAGRPKGATASTLEGDQFRIEADHSSPPHSRGGSLAPVAREADHKGPVYSLEGFVSNPNAPAITMDPGNDETRGKGKKGRRAAQRFSPSS